MLISTVGETIRPHVGLAAWRSYSTLVWVPEVNGDDAAESPQSHIKLMGSRDAVEM